MALDLSISGLSKSCFVSSSSCLSFDRKDFVKETSADLSMKKSFGSRQFQLIIWCREDWETQKESSTTVLIANVNGKAAHLQVRPVGFLLQWNSSMTKLVDKVICPAYTQQQFRLNLIKRPGIPCKWWRAHVWWMAKCCSFSSKYL